MGRTRKKREEEEVKVTDEIENLRSERDEFEEKWRRAAADYQNLRRRGLVDSDERLKRSMLPLLEGLLTVLDYLDMALASPATHEESKNLAVGVRLTRDHFLQALEREEVRPIPVTEEFDPTLHEAKNTEVRDDVPEGSIVETVRTGYTWRGEVLRYAQVVVARAEEPDSTEPKDQDKEPEAPADGQ